MPTSAAPVNFRPMPSQLPSFSVSGYGCYSIGFRVGLRTMLDFCRELRSLRRSDEVTMYFLSTRTNRFLVKTLPSSLSLAVELTCLNSRCTKSLTGSLCSTLFFTNLFINSVLVTTPMIFPLFSLTGYCAYPYDSNISMTFAIVVSAVMKTAFFKSRSATVLSWPQS